MRWLKRKAYNDPRSVLRKAGYEFERLPPVLVGNLEVQKRGALLAHIGLPYTTPLEMTFAGVHRCDEALGAALRTRLRAGLEGGGALEGVRAREGRVIHTQNQEASVSKCCLLP